MTQENKPFDKFCCFLGKVTLLVGQFYLGAYILHWLGLIHIASGK